MYIFTGKQTSLKLEAPYNISNIEELFWDEMRESNKIMYCINEYRMKFQAKI